MLVRQLAGHYRRAGKFGRCYSSVGASEPQAICFVPNPRLGDFVTHVLGDDVDAKMVSKMYKSALNLLRVADSPSFLSTPPRDWPYPRSRSPQLPMGGRCFRCRHVG
jgi:hypothetical protein